MSCVTGPFSDGSVNYLLVSDYRQRNVYQLEPGTGALRSLFADGLYTVSLALDHQRAVVYLSHVERVNPHQYHIRKRSFDGNTDFVIYTAQPGNNTCTSRRRKTEKFKKSAPLSRVPACLAGVKAGRVHLCRRAGNTL